MNNLAYIYDQPLGPRRPFSFKHDEFQKSYEIEASKSTDILDSFGRMRYNVSMTSQISSIDLSGSIVDSRVYRTTVSQFISNDICAFLQVPEEGYEIDYAKALSSFETCVQRYSSLVQAEMKDFNDIDVYKENIGYEVTQPKCCMFCKWAEKKCLPNGCPKIECHSPKNQQVFTYSHAFPKLPNPNIYRYGHPNYAWQKLPWQKEPPHQDALPPHEWFMNRIFPTVDPFGVCDDYAPCKKDKH